jgi:ABC transporter substrate binding protein
MADAMTDKPPQLECASPTRRRSPITDQLAVAVIVRSGLFRHHHLTTRQSRRGNCAAGPQYTAPQSAARTGPTEHRAASPTQARPLSEAVLSMRSHALNLVNLGAELVVTLATPATDAVRETAVGMPIVFRSVSDPISAGFVQSFSSPAG